MKVDIEQQAVSHYFKARFKLGYYNELRDKILPLIEQAVPTRKIRKDFKLTNEQITFLIMHKTSNSNFNKVLGSKTESYYSENEMMKPIEYSYNKLSPDEKLIYNTKCHD
jgi:hypothetical protein